MFPYFKIESTAPSSLFRCTVYSCTKTFPCEHEHSCLIPNLENDPRNKVTYYLNYKVKPAIIDRTL